QLCGFDVIMTDLSIPTTVRRTVAFSPAVYEEKVEVEGVIGRLAHRPTEINEILRKQEIAVIVDPELQYKEYYQADVVVDAILAKRNLGTSIDDARIVIGVGPGFVAGEDCHAVVETMRGHYLGKVITKGSAIPNTGIPGNVGGYTVERIIRATGNGVFQPIAVIGDQVTKGDLVAHSGGQPIYASMTGIVRGMLQEQVEVTTGMKCGDIDARCEPDHCYTVSDKARAIGGGVLEAILRVSKNVGYQLEIHPSKHHVIAVVGAGGKTSLIYTLAEEFRQNHKKVIVTTTTHMMQPGTHFVPGFEKEHICEELEQFGVITVGVPCEKGKIQGVTKSQLKEMSSLCDVLLIEADGAHKKSMKVPTIYEPVLPDFVDLVIGMLGASVIGKPLKEVCHRFEMAAQLLQVETDHIVSLSDLEFLLESEAGQKKGVTLEYRAVIGQGDLLKEQRKVSPGIKIVKGLQAKAGRYIEENSYED
ncbi:MAG: selenium-dependent molybdenum cofactor biosynthesis protein YqeB, partial [Lachnospiraceae bacterium]